jgi:hypothetical protein
MRPVKNWREVLRYAWSLRFIVLAAILSAAEVVIAVFMDEPPIARGVFAALAGLVTIAAALARFVAQSKVSE